MASTDRREDAPLIERLFEEPYRFEFFQAVRHLERASRRRGDRRRGTNPTLVDAVRFAASHFLGFPASAIQDLRQERAPRGGGPAPSADGATPAGPPVMTVNFFGLIGPLGVLPKLYTSYVRERATRHGDRATADFLDIFNHRAISLFYRAWEKYRVVTGLEGPDPGTFTRVLFALIGLGSPALRGRQSLADEVPLAHAALLARQRRSAEGLKALLAGAFGLPVEVVQLVGRWVAVDETQRVRLGQVPGAELGAGYVLGARVFDEQSKFRLRFGPLSAEQFRSLVPGRRQFRRLCELTRLYVGPEFEFDVQLVLEPGAAPRPTAGTDPASSIRLGRFGWFPSADPGFEHGAIFESRA